MNLTTSDGRTLVATAFPAESPRASVVIAPAMGVPQRYYARFAAALAARGFWTLTFDYRGIGASKPGHARDVRDPLSSWGHDLSAALRAASAHGPVLLVTHSVGGQLLAFLEEPERVRGAVMVASQFGATRHWDGLDRVKVALFFGALIPGLTPIFGYFPGRVIGSEDLPPQVALDWARWGRHPEYVLSEGPHIAERYARIQAPILSIGLTDDGLYAPPRAVDALAAALTRAQVTRLQLGPAEAGAPVGHFGFFRDRFADTLWPRAIDALTAFAEASPR